MNGDERRPPRPDTNVIIQYLNGLPVITEFLLSRANASLVVSDITRLELLSFPHLTELEKDAIDKFLDNVAIDPVTETIGYIAIAFRKANHTKLPDAIIAATAINAHAILVTSDKVLLASSFPVLPPSCHSAFHGVSNPFGWFRCHSHALATISSRRGVAAENPSTSCARNDDATS